MSRGRPNKGPADGYPLPKPQERPHPGLAEGPKQPEKLPQKPLSPREWPRPRLAEGGASLELSLVMLTLFFTTLLLALCCVPTNVRTSAKTMSCRFYSCSFGLRPPVACQGDSEPSLGRVHWWSKKKNKKKHSKRILSSECLVTAVQRLVLLVPADELQPSA